MSFTQQETLTIPQGAVSAVTYLSNRRWPKDRFPQHRELDLKQLLEVARYHAYSIWLFTVSDIKTIIAPSLLFALFTSPALSVFGMREADTADFLRRTPLVLFWLWINLLPFNIDNQRHPDSIDEDAVNKPWRTLPSKRMRPEQARNLMLVLYPLAIITSLRVGGTEQCLSLVALGFWYNNLQGADSSFIVRNLINAAGFNRFTTGALEVALGGRGIQSPSTSLLVWQAIIAGIVFTTVQTQDMYDQEGDSLRDRKTVPLVVGDSLGRWSIAFFMTIWSLVCPAYVGAPLIGFALMVGLGGLISARSLLLRSVSDDRKTFKLWNLFLVVNYLLPLLRLALGHS
jgi:4-hydroxybenzoate polyprenyltransferase